MLYPIQIQTSCLRAALLVVVCAAVCGGGQASGAYAGKPYQGAPQTIPGRVQMEFYDVGGPEVAYHDTDAENNGSGKLNKGPTYIERFRQDEGVDLSYTKQDIDTTVDGAQEKLADVYLGWTAPGEWVKYTVDVHRSGTHAIRAHMTSRTDGAEVQIAFDGVDAGGPIQLPGTTHWHKWRMAEGLRTIRLEKGIHVMTFSVLKEGNFNLDYLEFVAAPAEAAVDAFEQTKRMARGVNIIGYDPLWKDFSKARFQARYFQSIREAGFQSVRLNLQAFAHMDAGNRLGLAWFRTLDWAIELALANGLVVILDEHDFGFCGKDPEACRPKLTAFWEQVAERYSASPQGVVFEILNEPNSKLDAPMWNAWAKDLLALIRKSNPTRTVIIGPAFWNNIHYLGKMELPEADRNLIVTVHYYLPMAFTHQGAPWNKETAALSGIEWGTAEERSRMVEDFTGVQKWAKAARRPILLGEFGAYDKAPAESRVRYTAAAARQAEALGWAWSYWQFDSDFILYDVGKDQWVEPIRRALIP